MAETEFESVKRPYEQARERERRNLASFLDVRLDKDKSAKGKLYVNTSPRAGKGRGNYTSGGRMKKVYNLSNWKWVEIADDNDFECIVSLNMPDVDPRSGNTHALFDRVGLLVSYFKDDRYYETTIYTNFNLPLSEEDMEKIAQLVLEQYKIYCEKKEG